jgi:hypothetical protein
MSRAILGQSLGCCLDVICKEVDGLHAAIQIWMSSLLVADAI